MWQEKSSTKSWSDSLQFERVPGDKEANFRKIETFLERAAQRNVRLMIFPELLHHGMLVDPESFCESVSANGGGDFRKSDQSTA